MDGLTKFVLQNSRFALLVIVAVVLGGFSVYLTQPRQEDPELVIRSAKVFVQYPGMSPERVEQLLVKPIEEQIKQITEIDRIHSLSMQGMAVITPEAHDRYTDMQPIWSELRNKMDDMASELPQGTIGPSVNDDFGRLSVITLALWGDDFSMVELESVAKDIRDELGALSLVAKVELHGVQEERVWLEFDPHYLRQFGMSPNSLIAAIQGQNIVLPGGSVQADGQRISIEPSGDFQSLEDIENVAIATPDGDLVYLQDVARVRRGFVEPQKSAAFYKGRRAIVLGISMVASSNVVELGRQVNARIATLKPQLPLGMQLDTAIFQPDLVQASVSSATENLLQTVAVVLVVVMLFLGLRTGLIVGAMVPLTMLATLIGMSVWQIELHRISIAAVIVALGLLVDNGVVIAEDIRRRLDEGFERAEAVLQTPKSLAIPLLTSSLTTVLAFMPLMLVTGGSGEFLRSLGQVLAMALLLSWFFSISITPALCYWFLKPTEQPTDDGGKKQPAMVVRYGQILDWVLVNRVLVIALCVILLYSAGQLFSHVKQRSLGPSERNQFTVYLDLPAGADINQTQQVAGRLQAFLLDRQENPEVTDFLAFIGSGGPRFFLALSPNESQANKAFLVVNTVNAEDIHAVMKRIDRYIIEQLPEAQGRSELLFLGPAALGTVEIQIEGPSVFQLRLIANQYMAAFRAIPGVQAIRNDWENAVLKILVNVDQDRARQAGVSSAAIADALTAYLDGEVVTSYREGEKSIPVALRSQANSRATLDQLRTVEIESSLGGSVNIMQVVDFDGTPQPSKIVRVDQRRAITVAAKHPDMTAAELYARLEQTMQGTSLPANYSVTLEGELKGSAESNEALMKYAPHALFGILLLLVLQFGSLRRSAVILLTIPLVFIGASLGLWAFSAFFDFTGMLGLFSLAGIIINNGIVLIDCIDSKLEDETSMHSAIREASKERARPIIMTTLTTVVGLIPMAVFGGEFWFGMAIVIMCGLAVASLMTLVFVPALYSLLMSARMSSQTDAVSVASATK